MAGKPIPIISPQIEKKIVEKSEESKRLAYGLKWDQFTVQKLKETFQINDSEIPYLDAFPKKICKLESERYIDCRSETTTQKDVVCKFEMYLTDSGGTSNWSYKIQLEVYADRMNDLLGIQTFDDFTTFLVTQHSEALLKLNDYVIRHVNRDQKMSETWICWNKIFKPRSRLLLKTPIRRPPVFESEYYRERGKFYQRRI